MRKGYSIDGLVNESTNYFYLFNWINLNEISLYGLSDENKQFNENHWCIGVWKIKNRK
jgi:hypothetical protein